MLKIQAQRSILFWLSLKPARLPVRAAEALEVPSTLALAVLVVPLVTVFTGAGFSGPSSSLPVGYYDRISMMISFDFPGKALSGK